MPIQMNENENKKKHNENKIEKKHNENNKK